MSELKVTIVPGRFSSATHQGLVVAPTAGQMICQVPASSLPAGLYSLQAFWGNLKITGTGDPALADLTNWRLRVGPSSITPLVSFGQTVFRQEGQAQLPGGVDVAIEAVAAGTANVIYAAGLTLTRLDT